MTGTVTGLFTYKSVPVVNESPCIMRGKSCTLLNVIQLEEGIILTD